MRVSNALIHQLIDKEYVDSVQKEQEITVFVSCNDALYIGRTIEQIRRLNPEINIQPKTCSEQREESLFIRVSNARKAYL